MSLIKYIIFSSLLTVSVLAFGSPKECASWLASGRNVAAEKEYRLKVAANLQKLLKTAGYTLNEVAAHLGLLNRSAVSHITTGKTSLQVVYAVKLAHLLKVDVASILDPDSSVANSKTEEQEHISTQTLRRTVAILSHEFGEILTANEYIEIAIETASNAGTGSVTDEELFKAIKRYIVQKSRR